ncbi:HpcH/HpaI aldolase/citrate lyase family protein [Haematobacter missouriensis]|uniref:CoA ester lyase n=1 Tax=Haematobacter missouriensis TaxID=366616 RepID=A0A212APJ9_9RHOB|nr:CoA ester lyase [Haematobacter missouriensis]OWJ77379.1 CoA ester lyase [Haematobacter missouriensis]OWJ83226.1 CoA ester lyase [Haematobacter missouriensis]
MRSLLFVPGDSPRKFAKAKMSMADVLILDLEDSVAAAAKTDAREVVRTMLEEGSCGPALWVRVNALDTGMTLEDLAAVMPLAPAGIVLPKAAGAADVERLATWLDAFEVSGRLAHGMTGIIAVATETAEAVMGLGSYRDASPRLRGLMWGAEDLAASLGATTNAVDGVFTEPFRLARNLCLMAAASAGVAAIDTVSINLSDLALVEEEARAARRDGFTAKAVIHPGHVEIVNQAFRPTEAEVDWGRRVIAAFEGAPEAGVVKLDGKMVDKPHERAARKILAALGE